MCAFQAKLESIYVVIKESYHFNFADKLYFSESRYFHQCSNMIIPDSFNELTFYDVMIHVYFYTIQRKRRFANKSLMKKEKCYFEFI